MTAKVFILALLVALASATPVTQDTSIVGYREAMDMFLDAWKKMIPCGFPSENIPALAPFIPGFYAFNYNNGETNLVGNVSNFRISGLNNFQVLSGSYDPTTLRATFDVLFPEVQILGSYEVEGTIGIGGLAMPIRQSVLINKKLSDWRFVGDYTFAQSLSNSNGLRIADLHLQTLVANVQAAYWDKFMDIATNNYFNSFINSFTLLFNEETQPYVNPMLEKYLLPTINNLLSNVDMTQLAALLTSQAEMWNNAGCTV